jgi:sulfur carrier protein ThiS
MITIKVNLETHQFSEILKAVAYVRFITINTNGIATAASSNFLRK